MCALTRLLVPAFLVGLAVATVFANDGYGWVAAGVTIGVLALAAKVRGTASTCAISAPPPADDPSKDEHGISSGGLGSR